VKRLTPKFSELAIATTAVILGAGATVSMATEPCGDLGECKALIEINSSDGDIGFHFLMDGDDLNSARIHDPDGNKVFEDKAKGPLKEQKLTETFAESAEPLCWESDDAEEDDEIVTLEEFLERWAAGTYVFTGSSDEGEKSEGESELTYDLPAAPSALDFDGSMITWSAGNDLGNCASYEELADMVAEGALPQHPVDVDVDAWEVVVEADLEDGDPLGNLKFTVRVAGDIETKAVSVPAEYLANFEDDTPGKIEIGAIGGEDNATFTEVPICINEVEGCEEDED
jgi:hypothetical protein